MSALAKKFPPGSILTKKEMEAIFKKADKSGKNQYLYFVNENFTIHKLSASPHGEASGWGRGNGYDADSNPRLRFDNNSFWVRGSQPTVIPWPRFNTFFFKNYWFAYAFACNLRKKMSGSDE